MSQAALFFVLVILPVEAIAKYVVLVPAGSRPYPLEANALAVGDIVSSIRQIDCHKVRIPDGVPLPEAPRGYRFEEIHSVHAMVAEVNPNDPLYVSNQWNYRKTLSPQGWAITTGVSWTVVAMLDSGIDLTHPDLQGKVIGGINYITLGASFQDGYWHGTATGGLVAADTNNGVGVAGQDWAADLLAVKVLDDTGYGDDYGVVQGMVWAVDQGARILSMSLGSDINGTLFQSGVNYALSHGVLVVASAGNGGGDDTYYPCSIPGVLSVGATGPDDSRAFYSSYGPNLQVMAPGGDGTGTAQGDITSTNLGGGYEIAAGTSFAAPQVSGAAALYWSIHPGVSYLQVFAAITATADPIDEVPGFSPTTAWGRLNVLRLLGRVAPPNVFMPQPLPYLIDGSGQTLTAGCGAGKPLAGPLNPDTSPTTEVIARAFDASGDTLATDVLADTGSRSYMGSLYVPAWPGPNFRTITVQYTALDSAGNTSVPVLETTSQGPEGLPLDPTPTGNPTPGASPTATPVITPVLVHYPPGGFVEGYSSTLYLLAFEPAGPPSPMLYYQPLGADGSFSAVAPTALGGSGFEVVLSPAQLGEGIQYYFRATDSAGYTARTPTAGCFTLLATAGGLPNEGLPHLYHQPPTFLARGRDSHFTLTVGPGLTSQCLASLYFDTSIGWIGLPMASVAAGQYQATVPGGEITGSRFDYYFTAVDGNGDLGSLRSPNEPFDVPIRSQAIQILPVPNPATQACFNLYTLSDGTATIRVYDLAGNLVDRADVAVTGGCARFCSSRDLVSGIYLGIVSFKGDVATAKLAVIR